ncbi:MAG: formate--tetrahydrofolate ligase [Kiritimatiellaeota bacterium]|nr:formate--tetrahydrofolate ligase [Kiritimatiellota bacterium]
MKIDPTKMKDWQVAEALEGRLRPIGEVAARLGIEGAELMPYGHFMGKVNHLVVLERLKGRADGKYVDVTAITPTPLGEGKTTTTMGLVDGLGGLGKKVSGAIRQPSGGPTFNIKGGAAGGGLAQCVPLTDFNLGLTGDMDAIEKAHNLSMVALTARLQHETNYDDATLAKKNLRRLDIDPENIPHRWVMDFSAQALRNMVIGMGDKMDGVEMRSGFAITVSSEVMAILAVAKDVKDLRERMGKIVVAYSRKGTPITTEDLEVAGAMTALMHKAIFPNLMQTLEGNPVFVHAGPFANIAIGQSSIVADRLALKLSDYHVTESGFGADIGFEKFWNLKCRLGGLTPNAAVIVATVRALKMHGGGPAVTPGKPLDKAYTESNPALVEEGVQNLLAHIETVRKSGTQPVVCINHFYTDSEDELNVVRRCAQEAGARVAVSRHWQYGGEGARELAEAVVEACNEKPNFKFLYEETLPHRQRIERIAKDIYGADGVTFTPEAEKKLADVEADASSLGMGICMVKTQYSLSHDPTLKGRPRGFTLPVRDILVYRGAGFIVPVAGDIKLMPGTGSDPAFRRIDLDVDTGKVRGLF